MLITGTPVDVRKNEGSTTWYQGVLVGAKNADTAIVRFPKSTKPLPNGQVIFPDAADAWVVRG